jgi:hypothetical protein
MTRQRSGPVALGIIAENVVALRHGFVALYVLDEPGAQARRRQALAQGQRPAPPRGRGRR